MSDKLKIDYGFHRRVIQSQPTLEAMAAMSSQYARVFHNPAMKMLDGNPCLFDHENTLAHGCLDAYL